MKANWSHTCILDKNEGATYLFDLFSEIQTVNPIKFCSIFGLSIRCHHAKIEVNQFIGLHFLQTYRIIMYDKLLSESATKYLFCPTLGEY